jgi:drug/metabolite transporter superfamily protein YnfA
MSDSLRYDNRDRSLARWAAPLLGESALILCFPFVLRVLSASRGVLSVPIEAAAVGAVVVAFGGSFTALSILATESVDEPRRLWLKSLFCNLLIFAVVVSVFGVKMGLAICVLELIVIALHVVALVSHPLPSNGR